MSARFIAMPAEHVPDGARASGYLDEADARAAAAIFNDGIMVAEFREDLASDHVFGEPWPWAVVDREPPS